MATQMQTAALNKALAFLKASGASYIIMAGDGDTAKRWHSDDMANAEVKMRRGKDKSKEPRKILNDFNGATGYMNKIKAAAPGEEVQFRRADYGIFGAGDKAVWNNFKSSVSSMMRRTYGSDTYIVQEEPEGVYTVMKV